MGLVFKTFIILVILVLLGIYDNQNNGRDYKLGLRQKKEWNLGGFTVKTVNGDSFYAENSDGDPLTGVNFRNKLPDGDSLMRGDRITFKSVHLSGDTVDIQLLHISRTRHLKIYLSIIPALAAFFLFFKYYRFDTNIMRFVEK